MINDSIVTLIDNFIELMRVEGMPLTRVYVYGKHVKGKYHEGDQILTAVVLEEWEDFDEVKRTLLRLRRNVDSRIYPFPYLEEEFSGDDPMAKEILETGEQIL